MKRFAAFLLVSLLLVSTGLSAQKVVDVDQSKTLGANAFLGYVPDRFIVVLKDVVAVDHARDMRSDVALSHIPGFDELAARFKVRRLRPQFVGADRSPLAHTAAVKRLARHYKVSFDEGTLEEAMAAYEKHPLVDHVEPIGIHTVTATPNDGYYASQQWHYFDTYGIDADLAWDTQTGSADVLVGVLDTGAKYDHGDLGGSNPPGPTDNVTNGNIWINGQEIVNNGVDDDGNGYVDDIMGWDFVERTDWYPYTCIDLDCGGADNDPFDGNGHGTHVSGTIAAITNNGYAVAGIAGGWSNGSFNSTANGVKIVPCRIGYTIYYIIYEVGVVIMDYVAEAMYYMGDLAARGEHVVAVNCSFGSSNSGGLGAACDYIIGQGVIVVVAAGNGNTSSPDYLGSRGDCLDVGATDVNGNPASFSNYGSWVDIAAPGVDVYSTYCNPDDPGNDYVASMDGTSMAAPHVCGVAALLKSQNPALTAAEIRALMLDNTKPYNKTKNVGIGIVDAKYALDAMVTCDITADFTVDLQTGCAPLTAVFTDLSTGTGIDGWLWDFGDGVGTSTDQNPAYTYTSPGTYTVTLTASSSGQGCSDDEVKVDYIEVLPAPVADFVGSPTSGSASLTVDFTDLSSGSPTSWAWDFGDGLGTSSVQNPTYTYDTPGKYTVELTVTALCGTDVESKFEYITVTEPGQAEKAYAYAENTTYGTKTGDYTDTWASDGVYEILTEALSTGHPVKTTSQLQHRWEINVPSGSNPTFYLEAYRTNNTDGDNFLFEYSTDGSVYSSLFTVASATEQVYSAGLPGGTSGIVYVRVTDTNRSWGNTSLDAVYVDEMYIEVETTPGPPIADFVGDPTTGYAPLTVNFTDMSTGSPTSWSWDFGDGVGTSAEQHPSYTYSDPGTYTVTLTATNSYGSDIEQKVGYITVQEMTGTVMHVSDITVTRYVKSVFSTGQAYVTIVDQYGAPVAGATVYGAFDDPAGTESGTTGSNGIALVEARKTKTPPADFCFTVTDVVLGGAVYNPGANAVTKACESGWVYGVGGGRVSLKVEETPDSYELGQNFPNPFNPVTMISFALPKATHVRIEVFNVKGELVKVLLNGTRGAGYHTVEWNAAGEASGIYFYRIVTGEFTMTRKMLLLR